MAEKRLIDADVACKGCVRYGTDLSCENCVVNDAPTIDAVEVVRCEKCVLHGNCITEDTFVLAGIENPFCCAGKRKEGADNDT